MARGPIRKEKDVRKEFNELLDNIFKKAEEIYKSGRQTRFNLSELEKMAYEKRRTEMEEPQRKVGEQKAGTNSIEQIEKWVCNSLDSLKDFVPKESAINSAMELYALLESAKKPEDLAKLKKWVVG